MTDEELARLYRGRTPDQRARMARAAERAARPQHPTYGPLTLIAVVIAGALVGVALASGVVWLGWL